MKKKCPLIYGHSKDYIRYSADMRAEGNSEYFKIAYEAENSRFNSFKSLYGFLQRKAHFSNLYEGNLIVDLSEWTDHENEEYFDVILSFLSDYQDTINPVFTVVMTGNASCPRQLINKIGEYFDTEEISTCSVDAKSTVAYIKNAMGLYDIQYVQNEIRLLEKVIGEEIKDTEAERICSRIVQQGKVDIGSMWLLNRQAEKPSENKGYSMGLLGGI